MTISSSSASSLIYARALSFSSSHTNTNVNAQRLNPLRGLTRWTVIRCPSLVDRALNRVTAPRTWLTGTPVDPQIVGILACVTFGADEVAQRRATVLECVMERFGDRVGEARRGRGGEL